MTIIGVCIDTYVIYQGFICLPKGRLSEAAHEKRLLCAQKCTRGGVGVGWGGCVMEGWDLVTCYIMTITGVCIDTYVIYQGFFFVYQKGDLVKQPMKKGSFVPKNVPGVGWGGCVMEGWDGVGWGVGGVGVSWRGGVGCVMEGVCHGGVGWGAVGCVMEGWGGSYTKQLCYRGQPSLSTHYTTW